MARIIKTKIKVTRRRTNSNGKKVRRRKRK